MREYFGPMLAVHVFDDDRYAEVVAQAADASPYALTGAIIAQDRAAIAQRDGGAAVRRWQLLHQRQADRRSRRPAAVRRWAGQRHERQGRLGAEPAALDQHARDQGDVRAGHELALPAHGHCRGERVSVEGIDDVADADFLARYFQHVAFEDLVGLSAAEKRDVAFGHREFASIRPAGVPKVRVFASPDAAAARDHRDRHRRHAVPGRLGHPGTRADRRRDPSRRAPAVRGPSRPARATACRLGHARRASAPTDALVESWMHLEVVGPPDQNAEETLRRDIVRVLQDVRDAVEDWPKMRAHALAAADALEAEPPIAVATVGDRRGRGVAALAGRRPLHLPRLPRVPAGRRRGRRRVGCGVGHRPRHPARRQASATPARRPARGGARQGARPAAAADYQGQLAVDRAPRRSTSTTSASRRSTSLGAGDRRAPVPRPVHVRGLHPECVANSVAEEQGRRGARTVGIRTAQSQRQGPHRDHRGPPARRAVPDLGARAVRDGDGRAASAGAAHGCGCSCGATSTAVSFPAWCTCRASATTRRCG